MRSADPFDVALAPPRPVPEPVDCVIGDTLCRVRVLTEAQWEAIPPDQRPSPAEYFPGLGWVVADVRRNR